jgi:hypothetical protein
MAGNWQTFKKLHKWPGLIISLVLLYYAITGIIMNHRELLSGADINRKYLPANYRYNNWNNAALKGNLIISPDSILVYGNIGIWLADSTFTEFTSYHSGFPEGSDNRKIFDLHRTVDGELYAATLFGLYAYDQVSEAWQKLELDVDSERFTGIESRGDTLYAVNRSHLYKGKSQGIRTTFAEIELLAPEDYVNQVTLFQTIWQLHSGELFGLPGKIYVDLLGLITLFLAVTGILYFFFPDWIRQRIKKNKSSVRLVRVSKWALKWHNKAGTWTFVFLIVLFLTGIFLRPPLLLAIARAKVAPLKYSHLDQPNPWYDKLRDIIYDERRGIFLLSTSEGMYALEEDGLRPVRFQNQPPVSVMGINTLEHAREGAFLVGSFSGLFLWQPEHPEIYNYARAEIYRDNPNGRPVGDYAVTGIITGTGGKQFMVDYNKGVIPLWHDKIFPGMPPDIINESKMSIWNVCLEIHTGRIFQNLTGDFYFLIVPLSGLTGVIVVISGYLLWWRKYRKKQDKA